MIVLCMVVVALLCIFDKKNVKPERKTLLKVSQNCNKDIYGWINIPNTRVNYPIVQNSEDNGFYLDHTYKKEESIYGAIYSEKINGKDFNDSLIILYGHAMNDGSMFGDLKKFMNNSFFKNNDRVYIYFDNKKITYKICAIYRADYGHLYYKHQLNSYDNIKKYFNSAEKFVQDKGGNARKVNYTGDPVLILSTCYQGREKERLVVICIQETGGK